MMKIKLTIFALTFALVSAACVQAEEKKGSAKPYPLKTCIVTDEALNGDHGAPYVFEHEGQEIKMCCKSCLKKFNKEKASYLKKLTLTKSEKKVK